MAVRTKTRIPLFTLNLKRVKERITSAVKGQKYYSSKVVRSYEITEIRRKLSLRQMKIR